jgi:putative transport protein
MYQVHPVVNARAGPPPHEVLSRRHGLGYVRANSGVRRDARGEVIVEILRTLLESSPLLALFLAIATGYAVGQLSIAGVSFGAGAVLFTGLIVGAIAPGATPPAAVGTLGLVMFVYGVGIQYGPQFFAGLRGRGMTYMALAVVAVVASLGMAILVAEPLGVSLATASGLFAGSATSTPSSMACLRV